MKNARLYRIAIHALMLVLAAPSVSTITAPQALAGENGNALSGQSERNSIGSLVTSAPAALTANTREDVVAAVGTLTASQSHSLLLKSDGTVRG